jgi:hypothetical protein
LLKEDYIQQFQSYLDTDCFCKVFYLPSHMMTTVNVCFCVLYC